MEVAISGKNYRLILAHIVPPFTTRISRVVGGTWGHLSANVGTSKHVGVNGVSTISLLGCSTSVALTTGPTDEEEEQEERKANLPNKAVEPYGC